MSRTKLALPLLLTFIVGPIPGVARDTPAFSAECQDVNTHGYREGNRLDGGSPDQYWVTDEQFHQTWQFEYDGQGNAAVDGDPAAIVVQHPGVLVILEKPSGTDFGASAWTYAINVADERVVGSEVNAWGGYGYDGQGVKARSTAFDCEFQIGW